MFRVSNLSRKRLSSPVRLAPLGALIMLSACAEGSILTTLSTNLSPNSTTSTTTTGGSIDGNSGIGGSNIMLSGTGFSSNANQQMFATIVDVDSNILLTPQAGFATIDPNGTFQMSWKNLVVPGQHLYIAYYADVNGNAFCNAIPTDGGWEVSLQTQNNGTVVSVTPDVPQRSVCELFGNYDLAFDSKTALSGHGYPGHAAYGAVVDLEDKSLVGEVQGATISSTGNVTMNWPHLLVTHHHYMMALCVDTTDRGACDSGAEYILQTGLANADVALNFADATAVQAANFNTYWPQNITLPPAPAGPVPTINGT